MVVAGIGIGVVGAAAAADAVERIGACGDGLRLVDRKGARFPVVKAWGCRNEILNAKTLFLADKSADYARLGLCGVRVKFTTESPEDCVRILRRYQGQRGWQPGDYTRGLYYRDVE